MPSDLGKTIRGARLAKGFGLREFAKEIKKSPAFVTQIECDDEPPKVAEHTLVTIAASLGLEPDKLIVLANRTPADVTPKSELEVALYRKVKGMSHRQQEEWLKTLSQKKAR